MVWRFRCPPCRTTYSLLPGGVLPYHHYAASCIAAALGGVFVDGHTVRRVSRDLGGVDPDAPAPSPQLVARWVARALRAYPLWLPLALQLANILAPHALATFGPPAGACEMALAWRWLLFLAILLAIPPAEAMGHLWPRLPGLPFGVSWRAVPAGGSRAPPAI